MRVRDTELPTPLIVGGSRGACFRDRIAPLGIVIGISVLISAGCVDRRTETDEAGLEPNFVQGLRYTDERTLTIAEQVLCGRISRRITGHCRIGSSQL